MYLLQWPDAAGERNAVEALPIPGMLSLLAFHDSGATVKGLKEFPADERPPVFLTWLSFKTMVGAGFALLRLRGRSLVPAMLAHGLLNAITFALALQTPLPAELPPPRPMLGAGLLLGGVALQAWLLRLLPR
jgi:cytochrome d ubiquinol oxidase subunit I